MVHFQWQSVRDDPRFGRVYRSVSTQPSWVWGTALTVGALVFLVPLVLLTAAALLMILIVWVVLSFVHRVLDGIGRLFGGSGGDGRRNVRVVGPDRHP